MSSLHQILVLDQNRLRQRQIVDALKAIATPVEAIAAAEVAILGDLAEDPWRLLEGWRIAGHRAGVILLDPPPAAPGTRAAVEPVIQLPRQTSLQAIQQAVVELLQVQDRQKLRLSDGRIDPIRCELIRGNQKIRLTQREVDILAFLAARPGQIVAREELLSQVWGHLRVVPTRSVDMAISRLRRKIEPDPAVPVHLLSCRGGGYRLALPERAGATPISNLIPSLSSFIGRESLFLEIDDRLPGRGRLVTLTGAPGVGKTRLAQEYALRSASRWPGGSWLCDLYPANTASGIYLAIAVALGLDTSHHGGTALALLGRMLASRGTTLLILDNAEHLVQPTAEVARELLTVAPGLCVLVTSQVPLGLVGEWLLEVPSLPAEEGVALFSERAAAAGSRWELDPAVAAEIVTLLDGLPLAIELAAARARLMSLPDILQRLDQRFVLLRSRQSRTDRHSTLEASLSWAWNLLVPWEQAALAQLAVFRGGFTLAAAESVLALHGEVPWTEDALQQLLDRSLLRMSLSGAHPRYSLLESVRLFALAAWEDPAGIAAARERHRGWFRAVGRRCLARSRGRQARESLAELVVESANLQSAWESCTPAEVAAATDLALALDCLLEARGAGQRRGRFLEQAIALAHSAGATDQEANLWRIYGVSLQGAGESESARVALQRAEALLEHSTDDLLLHDLYASQAEWQRRRGSLDTAQALLERASRHASAAQDAARGAMDIAGLVHLEGFLREGVAAKVEPMAVYERSIQTLIEADDYRNAIQVLQQAGSTLHNQGDHEGMLENIHRALQLVEFLPQKVVQGLLLGNFAIALTLQGRFAEALQNFTRSLDLLQQNGQILRYASVLHYRAAMSLQQGRLPEARRDYAEELGIMRRIGDGRSQAHALEGLAQVAVEEGDPVGAAEAAAEGLRLAEGCADIVLLADLHLAFGIALYLQGSLSEAGAELEAAAEVAGDRLPPEHKSFLACLTGALAISEGRALPAIGAEGGFATVWDALTEGDTALPGLEEFTDPSRTHHIMLRLAARAARYALGLSAWSDPKETDREGGHPRG